MVSTSYQMMLKTVIPYLSTMDDTVIDTDVTPNRGDTLSIYGNVNDIAAFYGLKLGFKEVAIKKKTEKTADLLEAQNCGY